MQSIAAFVTCSTWLLYTSSLLLISAANMGLDGVPITVIDLRNEASQATILAAQTCTGFFNRDPTVGGAVYTLMQQGGNKDLEWLADVEGILNPTVMPLSDFFSMCMSAKRADGSLLVKGYIRYNFSSQQLLVPNIITLTAVLDAVPFEDDDHRHSAILVADALALFAGYSAADATSYMHSKYVSQTTGMAKMNPGLDVHSHPINPPLTGIPNLGLVDYIVKARLFNFFLNRGCIPFTADHAVMEKVVQQNPWPRPVRVFGYDDTLPVAGGDVFEAETNCVREHNLGQVASDGSNNLGFFSRKPKISTPLPQNPQPRITFNASKTYLVLVVGDGDNLNMVKGSRKDWMKERLNKCLADSSYLGCFPLSWTMSPAALDVAPDMLTWYYNTSHLTGSDYFVLPPSGHSYSYPGEMPDLVQDQFVKSTEEDCILMSCSTAVSWEWALTWETAMKHYFPKYGRNGIVRGFFAANVPFMLPIFEFTPNEFYKVVDRSIVLFKPREWRGYNSASVPPFSSQNYLTPAAMAAEINKYPAGTMSHIYLTSDGGASLDSFYELVRLLDEHVLAVSPEQLVDLVTQKDEISPISI